MMMRLEMVLMSMRRGIIKPYMGMTMMRGPSQVVAFTM
jgi:hypothetical protein